MIRNKITQFMKKKHNGTRMEIKKIKINKFLTGWNITECKKEKKRRMKKSTGFLTGWNITGWQLKRKLKEHNIVPGWK